MRPCAALRGATGIVLALALSVGAAGAQGTATQKAAPPSPQPLKSLRSKPAVLPVSREPGRPGSFELAAAALWFGPGAAGASAAILTPNRQGGSGQGFTWFRAGGEYAGSAGVRGTVAYNLTRVFALEAAFGYSPSSVRFQVSDDGELAPGFTSSNQRLSEFFFDAGVAVRLRRLAFARGRGRPFVAVGGGYLRQLHAGRALVEEGQAYYAGGGMKYLLAPRARGLARAFGFRLDARLTVRTGGFSFDDRAVVSPSGAAGVVAAF